MDKEKQRIAIAEARGMTAPFTLHKEWEETDGADGYDGFFDVLRDANDKRVPDYLNSLDAMYKAEEILEEEQYSIGCSSNPYDHAPMRYVHFLCEAAKVELREEHVLSVAKNEEHLLNKRSGPWPAPIKLPSSAIVLSHSVPATGCEMKLIRATAAQRAEALLKTIGKWEDS
jgi:hypothetical protein